MKYAVKFDGSVLLTFSKEERGTILKMLELLRSDDPSAQIELDRLISLLGGEPSHDFPGYEMMQQ